MLSLLIAERRRKLIELAARARRKTFNRIFALILVITYNLVGFGDIISTEQAIASGNGYEANPLMRAAMNDLSWADGWIAIKLILQFLVTAMILWYPHRYVLILFATVMMTNGLIVLNNFAIAGLY